jgi:hypothetical protein
MWIRSRSPKLTAGLSSDAQRPTSISASSMWRVGSGLALPVGSQASPTAEPRPAQRMAVR